MNQESECLTTLDIIGVIGVGKSTAAKLLGQETGYPVVPEDVNENPFLARFYKNPKKHAFSSQLFFLNAKIRHLLQHARTNSGLNLVDTSVYQDVYGYAQALKELGIMSPDHWELYHSIFETFRPLLPPTVGIVHLTATPELVLSRIKGRGRKFEKDIDPEYLAKLHSLNVKLATTVPTQVLTVDTTELNLVANNNDKAGFVQLVRSRFSI